jgi:hypothetical protein
MKGAGYNPAPALTFSHILEFDKTAVLYLNESTYKFQATSKMITPTSGWPSVGMLRN